MNNIKNSTHGFSLIEMMIAVAVLAIISTGIASLMSDTSKIQKQVEFKAELVNFQSLLTLSMQKPDYCKTALGITSATPVTIKSDDAPVSSGSPSEYNLELQSIQIPGYKKITENYAVSPGLLVKSLSIKLERPAAIGSNFYIANLVFKLKKENSTISLGAQNLSGKIPIYVEFGPEKRADGTPTNSGLLQIEQCYTTTKENPESQCRELGGRWLGSTNNKDASSEFKARCPKTRMSQPRCTFGNIISLQENELPDGISCDGASNNNGERPVNCHYIKDGATTTTTYKCPSYTPSTTITKSGNRCLFNTASNKWEVIYKTAYNRTGTKRYDCNAGVDFSKEPDDNITLAWNEPLVSSTATFDEKVSDLIKYATRPSECKYSGTREFYATCNQDESLVLSGERGTCQFVHNTKLITCDEGVCPHTGKNGSKDGYTGWIHVTTPRRITIGNTTSSNIITEAKGKPCFEVKLNMANGGDDIYPVKHDNDTAPAPTLFTDIGVCITNKNGEPNLLRCTGNLTSPTDDILAPDPEVELSVKPNADASFRGIRNFCWYAKESKIRNTNSTTGTSYTGWIYVNSWTIRRGEFVSGTATLKQISTNNPLQNAILCNGGVRAVTSASP